MAQDVLQSHGKRCPSWAEFSLLAFGVTEQQPTPDDPVTTQNDLARRSRWGVEQASGCLFIWGADIQGVTGEAKSPSSQWITDGRGNVWTATTRAINLGGYWNSNTSDAGSRAASWSSAPDYSAPYIGARGISDHQCLGIDR